MTPLSLFEVPEVLDVHEVPSEEVRIVPESPTATKVLFAKVTPYNHFEVPEVLDVHKVPSEDVRIIPESPTETNNGLEVVVAIESVDSSAVESVDSSFSPHEMIVKLKRKREKMMSICLTRVPISGLGKPKLYQNMWCFTRKWEDCGGCLTL